MIWRLRTRVLELDRPRLVGILNVTPDSFSDGGRFVDIDHAVAHARRLVDEGADIVDVGGESTRPGSLPVSVSEETERVIPVVERLAAEGMVVSVDTSKPEVALAAVAAGAEIINDVTGMRSPGMRQVASGSRAGVVVMHMKGSPADMQTEPRYEDVVTEVADFLEGQVRRLIEGGVSAESVVVDPGIGFGKTTRHNLELLAALDRLGRNRPVMLGVSRKSLFRSLAGIDDPVERDRISAVAAALAVGEGVRLFRVHNVAYHREATALAWAMVRGQP